MPVFTDKDCDSSLVQQKRVAVIGYGSQGHAHALNLCDSGVQNLKVGLREGSSSADKARQAGLEVASIEDCAKWADIVMLLLPDEYQATLYQHHLHAHMKQGASLAFAHGFNVHFGYITPRADLDVWMIAPKEIGHVVRSAYVAGGGVPSLFAMAQDATGQSQALALSYACAIGSGRAGILETSFKEECEIDLFGEQAVLFGGLPPLMRAAYEVLVEAGYTPEMAYFKCIQQVKLVADAIYHHGIAEMNTRISNAAEYGGYIAQDRLIASEAKREMKALLAEIQSGDFARAFMKECTDKDSPMLNTSRRAVADHPLEAVGKRIRKLASN